MDSARRVHALEEKPVLLDALTKYANSISMHVRSEAQVLKRFGYDPNLIIGALEFINETGAYGDSDSISFYVYSLSCLTSMVMIDKTERGYDITNKKLICDFIMAVRSNIDKIKDLVSQGYLNKNS